MSTREERELAALTAQSTDWLIDEAERIARMLLPDVGTISVCFAHCDGLHSAYIDHAPYDHDRKPIIADSASERDYAETRKEALALLVIVLREKVTP